MGGPPGSSLEPKKKIVVVFRVDASFEIGSGHVMRCLTLADELKARGANTHFLCRNFPGHMTELIQNRGHTVTLLQFHGNDHPQEKCDTGDGSLLGVPWKKDAEDTIKAIKNNPGCLIVDHYGIGYLWHRMVRSCSKNIMVIDDLSNRKLDCDLLLDQTYKRKANTYKTLIPDECQLLLGADYTLVRPEFANMRQKALAKRRKNSGPENILVFMGGMDQNNMTRLVLMSLEDVKLSKHLTVNVVLGNHAPHMRQIKEQSKKSSLRINILKNVRDMASLMLEADFAIGAGGTASWERCCLGLPSLLIICAQNQEIVVKNLSSVYAAINLGPADQVTVQKVSDAINGHLFDKKKRRIMSRSAAKICDGRGVYRVAQHIIKTRLDNEREIYLRPASQHDVEILFQWQSDAEVRKFSRNPDSPTWSKHIKWFGSKVNNHDCLLNMIIYEDQQKGMVRLDRLNDGNDSFEISIIVDPETRGIGLAAAGVKLARELVPKSKIVADVHPDNIASQSLFEQAGYKKVGTRTYNLQ